MSSTPNYGYQKQLDIVAMDAIDRDMKRVEDKADSNTSTLSEHANRITQNQNHIECLNNRIVRAESDIADRYTKAELDARLDCKAGKCELEKHMISPHAHQELFDQKVDKREGYGLISDGDLAQIGINKGDITIINDSISRMYTQEEVDTLLANKANIGAPEEYRLPLTITEGDFNCWYSKNAFKRVYLDMFFLNSRDFVIGDTIAYLPVGYRPVKTYDFQCTFFTTNSTIAGIIRIANTDGKISILAAGSGFASHRYFYCNLSFPAV